MELSTIAKAVQASMHGSPGMFTTVTIDSRKVNPGDCFVAIKGENFDGHDFIQQAITNGATAILASRAPLNAIEQSVCFLEVDDTVLALGRLAAFWRDRFPVPMIGVTGSCGKTTVKGMITAICETMGKTLSTQGNFNNHIGLPLTLLRLDSTYRYAVIEMGASAKGEIEYLGKIAKPNVSLITNIAPAHILGFGSLEGVAQAKSEIYSVLPQEGIAVLNLEEPFNASWRTPIGDRKVITFGLRSDAMVRASEVEYLAMGVRLRLHVQDQSRQMEIGIPGKHTVLNILASAAATSAIGISIDDIVQGLGAFEGVPGRLCRYSGLKGACVIDDTYNANPGSVNAALDVLAGCKGQTVFVMGDMAELGDNAADYHARVGTYAREKGISQLLAVGKFSELAVNAFGKGAMWYPTKEALVEALKDQMASHTVVLIKGSRSSQMEVVTKAIVQRED